jgi:hypothetical protein
MARRCAGGIRRHAWRVFIARKTTLSAGIYAEEYRSATRFQSTVSHHASM